jgi:hypothetical protein
MTDLFNSMTIGNWSSIVFSFIAMVFLFKINTEQNKYKIEFDELLDVQFNTFKKGCESNGAFAGGNNWTSQIKHTFSKEKIIKLYKMKKFNNYEVAELLANNTITQTDL